MAGSAAERLRAIISIKGLSQTSAAKILSVSVQLVNQIIQGRAGISKDLASRAEKAWDIPSRWFLYGDESELPGEKVVVGDKVIVQFKERRTVEAGPVLSQILPTEIKDGEAVIVELADGRRLFRRLWRQGDKIGLESISQPREALIEVNPRKIRRAWRVTGLTPSDE